MRAATKQQNPTDHNVLRTLTITLLCAWMLLTPSTAHASGGWEGIGYVFAVGVGLPIAVIGFLILALVTQYASSQPLRRIFGVIALIVGILSAIWQIFWVILDYKSLKHLPNPVLMAVGLAISLALTFANLVLGKRLVR